jgi:hypothetical protein
MIGNPFLPIFTRFPRAGKRISIYIHFDPFINQHLDLLNIAEMQYKLSLGVLTACTPMI